MPLPVLLHSGQPRLCNPGLEGGGAAWGAAWAVVAAVGSLKKVCCRVLLVEGLLGPVGGVETPVSVARELLGGGPIKPERWAGRQRWQGERTGPM